MERNDINHSIGFDKFIEIRGELRVVTMRYDKRARQSHRRESKSGRSSSALTLARDRLSSWKINFTYEKKKRKETEKSAKKRNCRRFTTSRNCTVALT